MQPHQAAKRWANILKKLHTYKEIIELGLKMKKVMLILIILAGFFPAVLAIAQYWENNQKEKEAQKKEIELKAKIDSLNLANTNLSNQIGNLSKDNSKLSHQLTETSLMLNANVKGGKEVDVIAVKATPTQIKISLKNNSKLPIYDVQLVILDYEEIMKCNKTIVGESVLIDKKCYMKNVSVIGTYNMSPKNELEIPNLLLVRGEYIHYAFQIKTRHGITLRHSIFKILDNKVLQSYRIYDFKDDKLTLLKEVNPLKISKAYWKEHFYSYPNILLSGYE